MYFNFSNHKVVYSSSNRKVNYKKEVAELLFTESSVDIPVSPQIRIIKLAAILPNLIDIGFAVATKVLKKRVLRYSGEYTAQNSFLNAGSRKVADISFSRTIQLHDKLENAYSVQLKAAKVKDVDAFYYYVEEITLDYAKARTTSKSRMFDYTIEIVPIFLVKGSTKEMKPSTIKVPLMEFGANKFDNHTYRTSFIPLSDDSFFVGASIKIIELNPAKIREEELLDLFETTSGDLKKIVKQVVVIKEED